jgi:hypothetical protein
MPLDKAPLLILDNVRQRRKRTRIRQSEYLAQLLPPELEYLRRCHMLGERDRKRRLE